MAAANALQLAGTMQQQMNNTMNGSNPGNALVLANGRSVSSTGGQGLPNTMTGGRRRRGRARGRGRRSRASRGGFIGPAINQAIVPLALLGMQQTYRRGQFKGQFKGRTNRRRTRRGRRRR